MSAPRASASAARRSATTCARFWSLTWTLAVTDFKLRFYGSVLGYVWTLVRPFAFFGVIYVVFTEIVELGDDVKNYRRLHPVRAGAVPVLRGGRRAAA